MATVYLRSADGNDSDDGSTWALAKATLASALTAAGVGGIVYVADGHAESVTSGTLTSPGTAASPVQVICVDDTGDPEPPTAVATTATYTQTTGATNFSGFAVVYGMTFINNSSSGNITFTANTPWWWCFIDSEIRFGGGAGQQLSVGGTGTATDDQLLELVNSRLQFSNVGQTIQPNCPIVWNGGSVSGSVAPTTLFTTPSTGNTGTVRVRAVDLSLLGSGKAIIGAGGGNYTTYTLENCKLGASVSVTSGTIAGQGATSVTMTNCDSSDTNYRYRKHVYQGSIYHEATIVRTGGASDGTTPISRKMVSGANPKTYSPLVSDPVVAWNETTGSSVTATVEVITDNVTLTDKEAWVEVEYLGTSGFPLALFANDRASYSNTFLGSGSNQASSSVDWTTTGLTTPVKQKLSVSFTPQEKGPIFARVVLAKPSTTLYFCPKLDLS